MMLSSPSTMRKPSHGRPTPLTPSASPLSKPLRIPVSSGIGSGGRRRSDSTPKSSNPTSPVPDTTTLGKNVLNKRKPLPSTSASSNSNQQQSKQDANAAAQTKTSIRHKDQPPLSTLSKEELIKQILSEANESQPENVFTVEVRAEKLKEIPQIQEFRKLRVLDLSSNEIAVIRGLQVFLDLRELKLYDNCITKMEGLENLKELTSLQLQHNKITVIGRCLENNKKLKILRLDGNQLQSIDMREMASCSLLTSLDVSFNELECIKFAACLTNLEELFACKNKIYAIPSLGRCKNLVELDLSENEIVDVSGLKGLSSLQQLDLSHNRISSLLECGALPQLSCLNVANNRLSSVQCMPSLFPTLEVFNASHNQFTDLRSFLEAMGQLMELEDLSIRENPMLQMRRGSTTLEEDGDSSAGTFQVPVAVILEHVPQLHYLDGIMVQKPTGRPTTPLMRPMTASQAVSSRTVENQLMALRSAVAPYEERLNKCYENLLEELNHLPKKSPHPHPQVRKESSVQSSSESDADEERLTPQPLSLRSGALLRPTPSSQTPRSGANTSRSRRRLEEARVFASSILSEK